MPEYDSEIWQRALQAGGNFPFLPVCLPMNVTIITTPISKVLATPNCDKLVLEVDCACSKSTILKAKHGSTWCEFSIMCVINIAVWVSCNIEVEIKSNILYSDDQHVKYLAATAVNYQFCRETLKYNIFGCETLKFGTFWRETLK